MINFNTFPAGGDQLNASKKRGIFEGNPSLNTSILQMCFLAIHPTRIFMDIPIMAILVVSSYPSKSWHREIHHGWIHQHWDPSAPIWLVAIAAGAPQQWRVVDTWRVILNRLKVWRKSWLSWWLMRLMIWPQRLLLDFNCTPLPKQSMADLAHHDISDFVQLVCQLDTSLPVLYGC